MIDANLQSKLMNSFRALTKSYLEYWQAKAQYRNFQTNSGKRYIKMKNTSNQLVSSLIDFNTAMSCLFPTDIPQAESLFKTILNNENFIEQTSERKWNF